MNDDDFEGWWKPTENAKHHYFAGEISLCGRYRNVLNPLLTNQEMKEKIAEGAKRCLKCLDLQFAREYKIHLSMIETRER